MTVNILPDTGYVRISQIIGDKKANPPIPPVIPVSAATWWSGVKSGRYPKPVKLGPRTTAWRVEDIKRILENGPDTVFEPMSVKRKRKAG